jgi:hypothetical protein
MTAPFETDFNAPANGWAGILADLRGVDPMDDVLSGLEHAPAPVLGIPSARMTRKPTGRRYLDLRGMIGAAKKLVSPLPAVGESVHAVTGGEFIQAALVPALLEQLGGPAALVVSSLGTNAQNVEMLVRELRAGRLTSCRMVLSNYFAAADKETCSRVVEQMRQEGQKVTVARCHAKMMLFAPSAGASRLVLEGSGNLRSSQSIEQICITNDPLLYQFHMTWISKLFATNTI